MPDTEPADMAFVPLDRDQARWLHARGEPSQVLLALLKAKMRRARTPGREGNRLVVPLDADQGEWLRAQDDGPVQALLAVLRAEIRREVLKKAVAEEHYLRSVIRKHARNLERQRERQHPPPPRDDRITWTLERQAERELLPTFDRSEDPRIRAAAQRYRFRFGIEPDGTWTQTCRDGSAELQRMRERRPGGWR